MGGEGMNRKVIWALPGKAASDGQGGHPALLWMSILCVRYERPLKGDILSVHLYRIKRQESVSVYSDGSFLGCVIENG